MIIGVNMITRWQHVGAIKKDLHIRDVIIAQSAAQTLHFL